MDIMTYENGTYIAAAETLPAYPCDICDMTVEPGERVRVSDAGLTVEHTACVARWFQGQFGREGLS